jgi:ribosomal protein L40E
MTQMHPIDSTDAVRCMNCHNRTGLLTAVLLADGATACRRCADHQDVRQGSAGAVVIVG